MGHGVILLACDAGPGVGLGHRRRMEALAVALTDRGRPCEVVEIEAESPVEGDVVVVDSYRHRADDPAVARAERLVVVDDVGWGVTADLVVDPAPGAVPGPGILAGPAFALLDPSLASLDPAEAGGRVVTVLVTAGGADDAGRGASVASDLRAALEEEVAVRLVVGPWSAGEVPDGVEAVKGAEGLGPDLAAADLVVTGGGVTMLEALALGRPTVAFPSGAGQERYLSGVGAAGAALVVGDAAEAPGVAGVLAADAARRRELACAAVTLVDGRGAGRVAEAVAALG